MVRFVLLLGCVAALLIDTAWARQGEALLDDLYWANHQYWRTVVSQDVQSQSQNLRKELSKSAAEAQRLADLFRKKADDFREMLRDGKSVKNSESRDHLVALARVHEAHYQAIAEGNWGGVSALLEESLSPLRRTPRRYFFAVSLLAAAYLRAGRFEEAEDVLKPVQSDPTLRDQLLPSERLLITLMRGDILFFQFRYREALEQYTIARDLLGEEEDPVLFGRARPAGPHVRLRWLWSAYRSGRFEESKQALAAVCLQDAVYWNDGDPRFFLEMMEVGANIVYQQANEELLEQFLSRPRLKTCGGGVSLAYVSKLARVGQFEAVVAAFEKFSDSWSDRRQAIQLAERSLEAARRVETREQTLSSQWRDIAEKVLPQLAWGSPWALKYRSDEGSAAERAQFVERVAPEVADSLYDEAVSTGERSLFLRAGGIYAIWFLEPGFSPSSGEAHFRYANTLFQVAQYRKSLEVFETSLEAGLSSDSVQVARELRARGAAILFRESRDEADFSLWRRNTEALFTAHPGRRSVPLLVDFIEEWAERERAEALVAYERMLVSASSLPSFASVWSRRAVNLLVQLIVVVHPGSEGSRKLAYYEKLLKRSDLGADSDLIGVLERANHTQALQTHSELQKLGRLSESVEHLEGWIRSNKDNAYLSSAWEEFLEELLERGEWSRLADSCRDYLDRFAEKREARRVRWLWALAAEAQLQFSQSQRLLKQLVDGQDQVAQQSARRLVQLHFSFLDSETRGSVLSKAFREGETAPENQRVALLGLTTSVQAGPERRAEAQRWAENLLEAANDSQTPSSRAMRWVASAYLRFQSPFRADNLPLSPKFKRGLQVSRGGRLIDDVRRFIEVWLRLLRSEQQNNQPQPRLALESVALQSIPPAFFTPKSLEETLQSVIVSLNSAQSTNEREQLGEKAYEILLEVAGQQESAAVLRVLRLLSLHFGVSPRSGDALVLLGLPQSSMGVSLKQRIMRLAQDEVMYEVQ